MWIIANHHWSVASSIWESKAWTPPETLLVISSAPSPERIRPRELTNNFLKKTPSPPQLHRQQSSPWFSCWPSHELSADSITRHNENPFHHWPLLPPLTEPTLPPHPQLENLPGRSSTLAINVSPPARCRATTLQAFHPQGAPKRRLPHTLTPS